MGDLGDLVDLRRIARALERIAEGLELGSTESVPVEIRAPISIKLDGLTVYNGVVRYLGNRSARTGEKE